MALPFDVDNDTTIGDEMEGTVVVDFADEMDGVTGDIGGDSDGGNGG